MKSNVIETVKRSMLLIKTETIEHASLPLEGDDSVTVTMLQSKFGEFYVTKETSSALVWEIERATFEHAETVYQAVIDRAKLAAGL